MSRALSCTQRCGHYSLAPCCRVFLQTLTGFSASQEIPHILWKPESSSPHSQVPATCPYPEPDQSCTHPTFPLPEIHLNIILPSTPVSPNWSLSPQGSPPKPCISISSPPIRATCPAYLILLDFITILGEQYRSLSSS